MSRDPSLTFFTPITVERANLELRGRMTRQHDRLIRQASVGTAKRLAELASTYPSLDAGPLTGAALAGVSPNDPAMAQMAISDLQQKIDALDTSRQKRQADNSPFFWSALKGVTRGATLLFDFLWEEGLTRPIRTMVGINQGMSASQAYDLAGDSDALNAMQGFFAGENVNIGSGFLAQSNLSDETQRALEMGTPLEQAILNPTQQALGAPLTQLGREQRETGIMLTSPGGVKVPVSPGRLAAINFAEPGSTMFSAISGMGDFSANIFLDPSNLALAGINKLQKAANSVTLVNAPRKGILSRSWDQYLQSNDGNRVIDWFTEQTDMEPVLGALKGQQAYADPVLASGLVESADRATTAAILRDGYRTGALDTALMPVSLTSRMLGVATGTARGGTLGARPVRRGMAAGMGAVAGALPGGRGALRGAREAFNMAPISGLKRSVGNVTKDTYLGYLSTRIGARGLSVQDLTQAVDDFGENMILMGLSRESRNAYLLRLSKAQGAPDVWGVVTDASKEFGKKLVDEGFSQQLVDSSITKLYEDYNGFSRYWLNRSLEPQFRPGANIQVKTNGEIITMPSAHLFNELIQQYIPILDPKKVRLAMRRASKLSEKSKAAFTDWEKLGDGALVSITDNFMNKLWKPMVLLRVAWPVRVIGEEQIRMAAMGLDSTFRHPIQWLSTMWAGSKAEDVFGVDLDDARAFQSAMSTQQDLFGRMAPHTVAYRPARYGEPEFWKGRGFEYDQLARDPISIAVAEAIHKGGKYEGHTFEDALQAVKDDFWDGNLSRLRHQMAGEGGRMSLQRLRVVSDGYIDSIYARQVDILGGQVWYNEAWGYLMDQVAEVVMKEGVEEGLGSAARTLDIPGRLVGEEGSVRVAGRENWRTQDGHAVSEQALIDAGLFSPYGKHEEILREDDPYSGFASMRGGTDYADVSRFNRDINRAIDDSVADVTQSSFPDFDFHRRQVYAAIEGNLGRGALDDITDDLDGLLDELFDAQNEIARAKREGAPIDIIDDLWADADAAESAVYNYVHDAGEKLKSPNRPTLGPDDQRLPPLNQEYIPTAEALRVADMDTKDFEALFSTFRQYSRLQPEPIPRHLRGLKNGVHGFESNPAGGAILDKLDPGAKPQSFEGISVVIQDNKIVGRLSYSVDERGKITDVHLFATVDPSIPEYANKHIARQLLMDVQGRVVDPNADDALSMVFRTADNGMPTERRVTLRQYLQALGADESAVVGRKVRRLDVEGSARQVEELPQGLYVSNRDSEFFQTQVTDSAEAAGRGVEERLLEISPDARQLDVNDVPPIPSEVARHLSREVGGGLPTHPSAGVGAAWKLLGEDEFRRLAALPKEELMDEAVRLYGVQRGVHDYDNYEIMEIIGAQEARKRGYDVIAIDSITPNIDDAEWVLLTPAATAPARGGGETMQVDELVEALREAHGGTLEPYNFTGLAGSTPISASGGAASAQRNIGIMARQSPSRPTSVANLPQGRPQYYVARAPNMELYEGLAKGRLDARGIILRTTDADDGRKIRSPKVGSKEYDEGQRGIASTLQELIGENARDSVTKVAVKGEAGRYDDAVDKLFGMLMGTPTDKLSRSPAFQQFYWKRIADLYPHLDEAGRAAVRQQIKKSGVSGRTLREQATDLLRGRSEDFAAIDRLSSAGLKVTDDMPVLADAIPLADADEVAKAFALHEVRDLLYDISRKHNFFEMTRNIFPFGEAWLEIVTRWANIIRENPKLIRRFQQGLEGARESGWFYNDPSTGEEVFNYPGSGLLAGWMMSDNPGVSALAGAAAGAAGGALAGGGLGAVAGGLGGASLAVAGVGQASQDRVESLPAGFQLTGRLEGLNLMLGQYMPGFGPVIQLPASMLGRSFLEDPDNKQLKELLLPFGFQNTDSLGDIVETIAPTWIRRGLSALGKPNGDDQRLFNNTVIDVIRAGSLNGEYDLTTPDGYSMALHDAQDKAKWIYAVRAVSAFAGPTPAGVRWDARDVNGQLWSFANLSAEYRNILDNNEGSHSAAITEFTRLFGLDPTVLTTPKTVSVTRRSVTEEGVDFQFRNRELFDDYGMSAYYLRPDDPDEEFNYGAYLEQLRLGTREALSPEQWVFQRNDFLGRVAYEKARKAVADRTDAPARLWLRNYRMQLMERYDGYNVPTLGLPERANRESVIREMETWKDDERIVAMPAAHGAILYLEQRQRAIDELVSQGYSPSALQNSNAGRIYRDWLRRTAQQIMSRHPDFVTSWTEIFSREIEDDDPQQIIPSVAGVDFNG